MRLSGKVIAVTGASGGIGSAVCRKLLAEGASVVALDLWPSRDGRSVAAQAEAAIGASDRLLAIANDVTSVDETEAAYDRAMAEFGRIDGVFLNAGLLNRGGLFEESLEVWRRQIDVNVIGVWIGARAAARRMIDGGHPGAIVITSSISGLKGAPGHLSYATTKHAVVGMMRSLALELGPHDIRVNSIHPTAVRTPMVDNLAHAARMVGRPDATIADLEAVYRQRHVLPRAWALPEDIANSTTWLFSEDARFVTGVTLPIDGGTCVR